MLQQNRQYLQMRNRGKDITQQFYSQIRNRQKQELFKRIREKHESQITIAQWNSKPLLQELQQNINISNNLQQLTNVIQSTNNHNKVIMELIDFGIHHILMNFIKHGVELEKTITLISAILSKPKITVADKFVKEGLLEYLFQFCQNNFSLIRLCLNIFGNIMSEDTAYSEIFLLNNVQLLLRNMLEFHVLQKTDITPEDEDLGFLIMWVLEAMAQSELGDQYKAQYLQIFQIVLLVMKRDILHVVCIQIIFFLHSVIREQMKYEVTAIINKLLLSISPEANFIKHFLIITKVFMPFDIDATRLAYFIAKCPKYISYSMKILQSLIRHMPENFPSEILNNEIWWQKIFQYCIKNYDKQSYVKILSALNVDKQWMFPIIAQLLNQSEFSLTLANTLLDYLHNLLKNKQKQSNRESFKKIVYYMKSYQVDDRIDKLYEVKNHTIQKKSELILGIINSVQDIEQ